MPSSGVLEAVIFYLFWGPKASPKHPSKAYLGDCFPPIKSKIQQNAARRLFFLCSSLIFDRMKTAHAPQIADLAISHDQNAAAFDASLIAAIEQRLRTKTPLALPLDEEIEMLNDLCNFDLGRYVLMNKGLNGYWTQYAILSHKRNNPANKLEKWILTECPTFVATQERFGIFQETLQSLLQPDIKLASIPCGLMDDLLSLNYSNAPNCKLYGIDIDPESLQKAEENAASFGMSAYCRFMQKNAWQLAIEEEFDIITSNGLNIYEPSEERVTALYAEFYKALRPNGHLITSFLTPPLDGDGKLSWVVKNPANLQKQRALFQDIFNVSWQCFRTEEQTRQHLQNAGFTIKSVVYDKQRIFPTIIARKP